MKIPISVFHPFSSQQSSWMLADYGYYGISDLGAYYFKALNFVEGQAMPDVIITITWPD